MIRHRSVCALALAAGLIAPVALGATAQAAQPTQVVRSARPDPAPGAPAVRSIFPGRTPNQIRDLAAATLQRSRSVHLQGATPDGALDLQITRTGGYGTITVNGRQVGVLRHGASVWVRAGAGWVAVGPRENGYRNLVDVTSLHGVAAGLRSVSYRYRKTVLVDGRPTSVLTRIESGVRGTLQVAGSGPARPLALHTVKSTGTADLTFTGYDARVTLPAAPRTVTPQTPLPRG